MKTQSIDHSAREQGALVIHTVRPRAKTSRTPSERLDEATGLVEALDLKVREAIIVPLRAVTPATLFGSGKVEEIAEICRDGDLDVVVVDDSLTPVQQRNLERAWKVKVIDRTGLILEIFARRARTGEGRLQVELARLEYESSRLVRTWTHLERQRGGFGFLGGPGETQIEADRRLLTERILKLEADLADVRRTRELQRRGRKRAPYPIVALVGYTNAGKSTLFNALTKANVLAKSMLFATLDTTLRRLALPGGRAAILTDTVGFISDLPHELVEAFRATLDEVREADVILHVRDIATQDTEAQSADVGDVLGEIGVKVDEGHIILEVWNKIDLLGGEDREEVVERAARQGALAVSSVTGEGLDGLIGAISGLIDKGPERIFHLEADDGEALAWLYRHGRVTHREESGDGLSITARLDPQALGQFERLRPLIAGALAAGP